MTRTTNLPAWRAARRPWRSPGRLSVSVSVGQSQIPLGASFPVSATVNGGTSRVARSRSRCSAPGTPRAPAPSPTSLAIAKPRALPGAVHSSERRHVARRRRILRRRRERSCRTACGALTVDAVVRPRTTPLPTRRRSRRCRSPTLWRRSGRGWRPTSLEVAGSRRAPSVARTRRTTTSGSRRPLSARHAVRLRCRAALDRGGSESRDVRHGNDRARAVG